MHGQRLARLRAKEGRECDPLLSIFFTVGYPVGIDPVALARELESCGVEMLELGLPFSDPIADGPVIQQSSEAALRGGMTLERYFELLAPLREQVTVPVFFMGYLNAVEQFGVERFCRSLAAVGIDGVIIPDLPLEEFERFYEPYFRRYDIAVSFLLTPRTPPGRVRAIDAATTGFLYAVCQPGTTGGNTAVNADTTEWLQSLNVNSPVVAGFGIRRRSQLAALKGFADGAIVGSEFIRHFAAPLGEHDACHGFFVSWDDLDDS